MAKKILLRVSPPSGDPTKGAADNNMVLPSHNPIAQDLDIRDHLAALVGKGNTLSPDDKSAIFGSLTTAIGRDKATKIMNHAYLFNQRPDILKLPLEDKIRAFYTIGSNDPDVNQVIAKSKSLGYGALPGFRESSSALNQVLSGKIADVTTPKVDPEVQKRVLLRINK